MRSDFRTNRSEAKTAISAGRFDPSCRSRARSGYLATTAVATALSLGLAAQGALAQDLTYEGPGNTWDNALLNRIWEDGGNVNTDEAWTNGSNAIFNDAVTLTVDADGPNDLLLPVEVGDITFNVSGVVIEGDELILTPTTPRITVTSAGHLATINSDINANQPILDGAGNLTLGGAVEATVVSVQSTGTVTLESGGSITDTGTGDVVSVQTGAFTANAGSDITGNVAVADLTTVTLNGAIVGDVTNDDTDGNGLRMSGTAAAGEGVTGNVINNGLLDITGDLSISGDLEQNSTSTLVVDHDTSVGTLTITSGDVEVNGGDLAVSGVTELNSASTLTVEAGDTFSTDSISDETPTANTNAGTITVVNGQVQVNNLLNNSGTVNLEGVSGATLAANGGTDGGELAAFDGSLSNSPAGTVALSGDAEITGSYTHIGAATLTLNNNTLYAETASVLGTLTISGTGAALVTTQNDANNPNSLTVSAGGVLTVQSGNSIATNDGAVLVGTTGTLNIETGGSADSDVTVAADATGFDLDGSVSGTVTNELATAGVTLAGSIGGDLINNGALEMDGALAVTGDVDSGGTFNITDTLTIGDGSDNMGSFAIVTGTGGNAVIQTSDGTGTISLSGAVTVTSGSLEIIADTITLNSGFSQGANVTLTADTLAYTFSTTFGSVDNNITADGAGSVLTFTSGAPIGAGGHNLTATNSGTLDFDITTSDIATLSVIDSGTIDIFPGQAVGAADIVLNGGTATIIGAGSVSATNTLTIHGGTDVDVDADSFLVGEIVNVQGVGDINLTGVLQGGTVNLNGEGTLNLDGGGVIRSTGDSTLNNNMAIAVGNAGVVDDNGGGDINNDSDAGDNVGPAVLANGAVGGSGVGIGIVNFDGAGGTMTTTAPGSNINNMNDGQINVLTGSSGTVITSLETIQNSDQAVISIEAGVVDTTVITATNTANATVGFNNSGTAVLSADSDTDIIVSSGDFSNSATGNNATYGVDAGIFVGVDDTTAMSITAEGSIINNGNMVIGANGTLTLTADSDGSYTVGDIDSIVSGTDEVVEFAGGTVTIVDGGGLVVGAGEDGLFVTGGTLDMEGATAITGDVSLQGGSTNLTADATITGNLRSNGGTLDLSDGGAGGGDLTVTGDYTFNAGTVTFGVSGDEQTLSVQGAGGATILDNLAVDFGELEATTGLVTVGDSGNAINATLTINAAGDLDAQAGIVVDAGSTIDNSGDTDTTTLTVNGDGLAGAGVDGTFTNENSGTFDGSGAVTNNGTITNQDTAIFNAGDMVGNTGTFTNSSSINQLVNGDDAVTLGSIANNAGTIENTGSGDFVAGLATGNDGIIQNTDTGNMTVGDVTNVNDGQLNQIGAGTLIAGAVTNAGNGADIADPATVAVSDGLLVATSVTNSSGLVSVSGDGIIQAGAFDNSGTTADDAVVTVAGTGSIVLTAANDFTNTTGTVNLDGGSIDVDTFGSGTFDNQGSGVLDVNGGQIIGGLDNAGQVNVQAGSGAVGTTDVTGNFTQTGGDTDMQGNFDVAGNVDVQGGSLTFTSGSTFSGGTLTTDTFDISGTATVDFTGAAGTIDAAGAFSYTSTAALDIGADDEIEGDTILLNGGDVTNSGALTATSAATTATITNQATLTSTGEINGNLLNSSTANLSGTGSDGVNGDFENDGTTVLTGDLGVDETFTQTSGTVDFNGPATASPGFTLSATLADIDAALDVNGGRLDAAATEVADAVALTISDDTGVGSAELGELTMEGADSTVSNTGSGQVDITSVDSTGSDDENLGTIENTGTGTIVIDSTFLNQGTLENSGALSNFTVSADLDNVGIVEQSGTGTFTVASYDNAGTGSELNVSDGLFTMGGALLNQTGTVNLSGGGLTASGGVTNSDDFNVTGGTLTANVLNTGGAANFALDSTAADGLIVGNVVNEGVMSLAGDDGILGITQGIDGNLTNQAGGAITLTGDLEVDGAFTQGNTGGDAGSVTFDGNRLTATSVTIDAPLTIDGGGILESTGAVAINEDTPGDLTDDLTIASGSTLLASGQTVTVAGDARVNNQAGGFVAAGTIDNAGDFTNAGTVGADENGDARDATDDTIVHGITALNNAGTFNAQAGSVVNALDFNNNSGGGFNLNGNTTLNGIPDQAPATSVAGGNFTNAAGSTFDDAGAFTLTLTDGDFTNNITNGDMLLDNGGMITVSDGNFVNNGTLTVQGAASVITVSNAASSFSGGGIIDLEDGASAGTGTTDDVLTINGAVTGGATLRFDVDLSGAGATDVLNVTSFSGALSFSADVLATGGIVSLDLINGDTTGLSFASGNVITASGSNTYLLQNNGVGGVDIVTDTGSGALAVAGNISLVQSLIGTIVNRPSSPFVSGLAYEDDDNCGTGSWARFTGGSAKGTARTNNGVTNLPSTVEADFYGFTGGVDYGCFDVGDGAIDIAGGMILGYNGGSTTQDVFATNFGTTPPSLGAYQSTTTADFSQTYVGGYVAMAKDAWSADVQLRFENAQFEFNNPSIDLRSAETETQSTTLSGSVSYSYPLSDDLTLVPTAGFGITRSSTDDLVFTDAGGTETGRLSFEDHTTKIGFVGATIAKTTIGEAGDSATNKFITATYYGDFSDDQQATYTSGGATLPVTTESLGDFGELSIGLSYIKILDGQVGKAKQLNASVRADARFSEDVEALSLTAQVRLQF